MKLMSNTTIQPPGFEACFDNYGGRHDHGDFFTPESSSTCMRCVCDNGKPAHCTALQCQIPKCKNYEQIPGKCCEYTCPRDFVLTGKSTVAVVVSLSIILIVILIAIVMIWRKIRRKEKSHKRLETSSTGSSQQETDYESLIQKHSIPNNLRQSNDNNAGSSSSSSNRKQRDHVHTSDGDSLSSSSLITDNTTSTFNNFSTNKLSSNSNINNMTLCTTNQDGTQAKVVILPKNELFSTATSSVVSSANSACASSSACTRLKNDNFNRQGESDNNSATPCCTETGRQGRHFEPPPPYSPPKQYGAFV